MRLRILLLLLFGLILSYAHGHQPEESPRFYFKDKASTIDFDKDSINNQSLKEIEETLSKNPNIFIEILGHSDALETKNNDTLLSYNRAKFIKETLVEAGHESCRIKIQAYGANYPLNRQNRFPERNRRVETNFKRGHSINKQIFGNEKANIIYTGCLETNLNSSELNNLLKKLKSYLETHYQEKLIINISIAHSFNSLDPYYTCNKNSDKMKSEDAIKILNKRKIFVQEHLNNLRIKPTSTIRTFEGLLNILSIEAFSTEC